MGKVIPMLGGGTADSDELTANKSHVLSGYTAVTHDSDGEPAAGMMPNNGAQNGALNCGQSKAIPAGYTTGGTVTANSLASQTSANAAAGQILSGQTAWVNGSKITGNMANRGNVSQALNAGGSYTIPAGYHAGSGKVTANSLASQTGGATVDDSKVLSGYTYWKDGVKRTGNLTISSIVSFKVAQYSNFTLIASWARPSKGPWSYVIIKCKQGSFPSSVGDGVTFYDGSGTSATKSLAAGTWYFRAWSGMNTNTGGIFKNTYDAQATCANNQIKGSVTITASSTFTVPSNVRSIDIFCVGGGGSGGMGGGFKNVSARTQTGAGGGGGRTTTTKGISVTPGSLLAVTIGAGGTYVNTIYTDGKTGGVTKVMSGSTVLASANGGDAGHNPKGSNGGSGSGAGLNWSGYVIKLGGNGGSDGGNGGNGYTDDYNAPAATGGIGQKSTTRAWSELSSTLYAGGGAGGSHGRNNIAYGGSGGGGNGCKAFDYTTLTAATSGGANTGGGGGGTLDGSSGSGGSGICLIRWGY